MLLLLLFLASSGAAFHVPLPPVNASCSLYHTFLVDALANLTLCFGNHAHPLRICEACSVPHLVVDFTVARMASAKLKDAWNRSCADALLSSDIIQVLLRLRDSFAAIWTESHCQHCFSKLALLPNGTVVAHTGSAARHFLRASARLSECLARHTDMPLHAFHFNHSACVDCRHRYHQLNRAYDRMARRWHGGVCMDFTDAVNRSRFEWSELFRCRPHDGSSVYIYLPGFVTVLGLVVFYVCRWRKMEEEDSTSWLVDQRRASFWAASVEDYSSHYQNPGDVRLRYAES